MLEMYLTEYCAPTLAGLKSAGMFRYHFESRRELMAQVRDLNQRLKQKGVCLIPLKTQHQEALLYLYRPSALKSELSCRRTMDFLARYGYSAEGAVACKLAHLRRRMKKHEFPHEVGLFLGYPLCDVIGFIENAGKNCCCTGCWKVYGDKQQCQILFKKYQKCREVYCRRFLQGFSLERLTVAAS